MRPRKPLALLLGLAALAGSTAADSEAPPRAWRKQTPDGRFEFVMLPPRGFGALPREYRHYPSSGMYPRGTTRPLWTVDWYAYDAELLPDGTGLVRPGPWARSSGSLGLGFYREGKAVRSYTVRDLVAFPWLMPHSASHFAWRHEQGLSQDGSTYTLTTLHRDRYVFDARTGEIISAFRLSLWGALLLFSGVVLGYRRWGKRPMTPVCWAVLLGVVACLSQLL